MNDDSRRERARALLQGLQPVSQVRRIRVLLAEDQAIVRQAVSLLLEYQEELEVVATAGNGREAIELADRVAVLHQGRLEQYAPPATLLASPATEYVKTLFERAHVR